MIDAQEQMKNVVDIAKTANGILPQTVAGTDEALSTLVGWFNNVVLYPIKKANITYHYKLESFEEDLRNKVVQIPDGFLQSPNLMIAGPTLEALKYTFDEESLRDMYVNLLASAMDVRKDDSVHPSYVEIIRQMNSLDAVLFKFLSSKPGYIKAINPNIGIKGTDSVYVGAVPEWFIAWTPDVNIFQTSAALIRLSKLGIIELRFDRISGKDGYDELKCAPLLMQILQRYQTAYPDQELEIRTRNSALYVNEYGKQFAQVCL